MRNTRTGIKNLKNTCFMNSIFQVLLTIPELSELLIEGSRKAQKSSLVSLFVSTFLLSEHHDFQKLQELVEKCFNLFEPYEPYTKQDAQEFFYLFLNKLQSELEESEHRETLEKLFKGETLINTNCGKNFRDVFYQLNLSINSIEEKYLVNRNDEERFLISEYKPRFSLFCCKNQEPITVNDCVRKYFENFSEYKIQTCEICKMDSCLSKIALTEFPKYLFISLKRFEFARKMKKISRKVFPLKIIEIYGKIYELISIVEHSDFMFKKHYKAYCKDDGIWTKCDDKIVEELDEEHLKHVQPYIMLYKLCHSDPAQSFPSNRGSVLKIGLSETVKLDHINMHINDLKVESEKAEFPNKYKISPEPKRFHPLSKSCTQKIIHENNAFQKDFNYLIEDEIRESSNRFFSEPQSLQSINENPETLEQVNDYKPMFPVPISLKSCRADRNISFRFFYRDFNSFLTVRPTTIYQTTNDKVKISPLLISASDQSDSMIFKNSCEMPKISPCSPIQSVNVSTPMANNPLLLSGKPSTGQEYLLENF